MGYGYYSEVYFAININNQNFIKIGETTNARRRENQLDEYYIVQTLDVNGMEKRDRLFVESYLRSRVGATERVRQKGLDYFECENENVANWICKEFPHWVEEANYLLALMKCGGTVTINFGASRKPIPPKGNEKLFENIMYSLEKYGEYKQHFRCDGFEQKEYFNMLKEAFSPFGYECITNRKTCWAYFTITKI